MFLISTIIFIFGFCIGSFFNVVILRLKNDKKITGRSHCPHCSYILKWHENIPLLSFIILRAKCSKCHKKISWQYPLVEFTTGLLFLIAFLNISPLTKGGLGGVNVSFILLIIFYWIVISFLIIIFVYDIKYYLIPDKISIPAIAIVFILQGILLLLKNNFNPSLLITHYSLLLLSAIIISGFFAMQFILSKGKWIGGGDIRLGFLMGLILGWPLSLVALFLSYILGLVVCLPLLILKKKGLKSEVPFGVFLTTATIIILFWGDKILNWYLSLF